jgi:serine phosphatase RsbU (regulator of sigma subunit)
MSTTIDNLHRIFKQRSKMEELPARTPSIPPRQLEKPPVAITPDDPLVAYFLSNPGMAEVDKLCIDSPVLQALKKAKVKVVVPMVNQGQLVGLLNLGPRLSEQGYSQDDRHLLNTLATQMAPAVRVAQLVKQQQEQARERERIEQELRVARLIQQTLLPRELPAIPGWKLAAYYQPARAVGGDFYDFLLFDDGDLGIVIGDVTDKGVPAALLMATTRSILRSVAWTERSPGKVLEVTNNLLCPDVPPNMFVTCLYAVLDPACGRLRYANAGHDLPYQQHHPGVSELRATGMPLGLMPGMQYEEKETRLVESERILFYSDGLIEAHNPQREMFGFARLSSLLEAPSLGTALIDFLLSQLAAFTGLNWEQEDDVTLVTLQRINGYGQSAVTTRSATRKLEIW